MRTILSTNKRQLRDVINKMMKIAAKVDEITNSDGLNSDAPTDDYVDYIVDQQETANNELTDQDQTVDRADDTEEYDQYEADDVDEITATDLMYDYNEVKTDTLDAENYDEELESLGLLNYEEDNSSSSESSESSAEDSVLTLKDVADDL